MVKPKPELKVSKLQYVKRSDEVCDADCLGMSDNECGADELITEQPEHSVVSLAECWQQATMNKGDFVISKDVLYHKDKWMGSRFVCTRE